MIEKGVAGIHINGRLEVSEEYITTYLPQHRDSVIRYSFYFVPIFGKRKELNFDFSSNPPKETYRNEGVKQVIIEKGIYYIEY
jgi:hypothetical protein